MHAHTQAEELLLLFNISTHTHTHTQAEELLLFIFTYIEREIFDILHVHNWQFL